jgi:cytochrome c5
MTFFLRIATRIGLLVRRQRKLHLSLVGILVLLVLPLSWIGYMESRIDFNDDAPFAGAALVGGDPFGDNYSRVAMLPQGWSDAESVWFYTTSQGSDLIPYDLFLALADPGNGRPLRDPANVLRWRYLPQVASASNPDALPVGLVRDRYKGRDYLGFSCSACHTGQLTYQGTAMRINGGPALANMPLFMADLEAALEAAAQVDGQGHCANPVCTTVVRQVLKLGHYADEPAVLNDLQTSLRRIRAYNLINRSASEYGYARLDAFGRIYNRVLEHVLRPGDLAALLPHIYDEPQLASVRATLHDLLQAPPVPGLLHVSANALGLVTDPPQRPLIEQVLARLEPTARDQLLKALFNPPNAPVSYPYVWDVPYSDYVQWNALAGNASLGPVGRNAGEVIGVFGTLDWSVKSGYSLSALIDGQRFGGSHLSFESSVNVHHLTRIEHQLQQLRSPQWPEAILGSLDAQRSARGERLFRQFCESCHHGVSREDPDRRLVANVSSLEVIGTDPAMASNSVERSGFSGMLRRQYANTFTSGNLLLGERAPAAALLTKATLSVVATPYPEPNPVARAYHFLYDIGYAYFGNRIQPSLKVGRYHPDNPSEPYASLRSYKGRPLNGIWATAPYLHNGSVPTLYDLLLPAHRKPGDPDHEVRPDSFKVGSREFDPKRVGLRSSGYDGFLFDTRLPGNSNAGHEYGTPDDAILQRMGRGPLTREERLDLLEYLKTL